MAEGTEDVLLESEGSTRGAWTNAGRGSRPKSVDKKHLFFYSTKESNDVDRNLLESSKQVLIKWPPVRHSSSLLLSPR